MVVVYGVNVYCAYDLNEWTKFGYGTAAGIADLLSAITVSFWIVPGTCDE